VDKTLFIKENHWGEKIPVQEMQEVAGGKGSNVSRVLKTWGEEAKHLLFLGGYTGNRVKELLEEEKIDTYYFIFPPFKYLQTKLIPLRLE